MFQMYRFIIFLILIVPLLYAQPQLAWVHTYDFGGDEYFQDVYALADGGFAVCGQTLTGFIVAIIEDNEHGDVRWMEVIRDRNGGGYTGRSIIEADNGDLVIAGAMSGQAYAFRITADAEKIGRASGR